MVSLVRLVSCASLALAPLLAFVLRRSSIGDPSDVRSLATATSWLGLVVVDEAGNASALRRVRVDLPAVRP